MGQLPLNAIRVFEATARLSSVSAAGDELHVTHAAVSHQLRKLEEWLGVTLFQRSGRGIRATEQGTALLRAAGPALRELEAACERMRNARGDSILVGCIPSIASRWLVPRLADFRSLHPQIGLKVAYSHAGERLADGDNDILITLGADPSPSVSNRRLFSRENRPVCSPHHLATNPDLRTPAGLAKASLLHDEDRDGWREWFTLAGVAAETGNGPIFADFNILATAVIAGHGVALCPVEVFREEVARGDLVVLSDIATNRDKAYYLSMRMRAPEAARIFADWFAGAVASGPSLEPL